MKSVFDCDKHYIAGKFGGEIIWWFGGVSCNCQIKIHQGFFHMFLSISFRGLHFHLHIYPWQISKCLNKFFQRCMHMHPLDLTVFCQWCIIWQLTCIPGSKTLFEQLTSDDDPFDMEDDDDEGEDIIEYHGVSINTLQLDVNSYDTLGNFCKGFNLANSVKIAKLKSHQYR